MAKWSQQDRANRAKVVIKSSLLQLLPVAVVVATVSSRATSQRPAAIRHGLVQGGQLPLRPREIGTKPLTGHYPQLLPLQTTPWFSEEAAPVPTRQRTT